MGWSTTLKGASWQSWLREVAGGAQVRPGAKLDPFGTSWRVLSTQAARWLPLIREGKPTPDSQRRQDQVIIDLRAANLVTGPKGLTPFGEAVADRWEGIPDAWEYELPLGVALLQEALLSDQAGFKEMLAFWWDIRKRFPSDEYVLGDEEAVILLQYLNRTVDGFNPWVELREEPSALQLPVPWADLEKTAGGARDALIRLREVLDPGRRLKGRVVFCRAMSLLFMRSEDPTAIDPYLGVVELPRRTERS